MSGHNNFPANYMRIACGSRHDAALNHANINTGSLMEICRHAGRHLVLGAVVVLGVTMFSGPVQCLDAAEKGELCFEHVWSRSAGAIAGHLCGAGDGNKCLLRQCGAPAGRG